MAGKDWQDVGDIMAQYYEYEEGESDISVKGRLKVCQQFWRDINSNEYILDVVTGGYKLPFVSLPCGIFLKNNASALKHCQFAEKAILELLNKRLTVELNSPPKVVNPLTVAVSASGKLRLVLDLRYVNPFIWKEKHVFEGLTHYLNYVSACNEEDPNQIVFDLKSAYHHIDIFGPHQEYLGFSWNFNGVIRYFKFTVLPFGLSSAGLICTKVIREVVKYIRSHGIALNIYIDDGISVSSSYEQCLKNSKFVKQTFINAGFVPEKIKSDWMPRKAVVWLGFKIDLDLNKLLVPDKKVVEIKQLARSLLTSQRSSRVLASFAGKVGSLWPALGHVVRIMTKSMQIQVTMRKDWDSLIVLSETSKKEVLFWLNNIETLPCKDLIPEDRVETLVYSDASSVAYGGYVVSCNDDKAHGNWSLLERTKSSTWRELKAVSLVLKSLLHHLSEKRVRWFTDNKNVVSIVHKGSMKPELQDLSMEIYTDCALHCIDLNVEWIPRSENDKADYLSNLFDRDDWGLTIDFFEHVDGLFGYPHTVDRFANSYNAKLVRFNSLYWTPGSEAIYIYRCIYSSLVW